MITLQQAYFDAGRIAARLDFRNRVRMRKCVSIVMESPMIETTDTFCDAIEAINVDEPSLEAVEALFEELGVPK